jgi:hypothetical protein
MDKSVVFFSQMGFAGKVPRSHPNMRTEFAQMCALKADHFPLNALHNLSVKEKYDHAILLIPKTLEDRSILYNIDIVNLARKVANKIWFMQEGPSWIFQDLPLHQQFWHYNVLTQVDGILTENETDIPYFEGILYEKKTVFSIPSLMIVQDEKGKDLYNFPNTVREGCILGGNFVRWYGGFDSYIVAHEFTPEEKLYCVSMGRKQKEETELLNQDLTYLPYMNWSDWLVKLNKFKYAIHLMPTIAAGTFAMNCSFLGIPCIGYDEADTQRILHPNLSIKYNQVGRARELARELKNNQTFYRECSEQTKQLWKENFSEEVFLSKMNRILQ